MPTSIKQALKKWEEATGRKAADSKEIKLVGVSPPIEKMEGPFHLLVNLEKLSLSTNMIQNIQNLQSFKSIKILSLGRNVLKSLQGVEAASETLEQLWISYNQIDKLKPLRNLVKLKVYTCTSGILFMWCPLWCLCTVWLQSLDLGASRVDYSHNSLVVAGIIHVAQSRP